MKRIKTISPTLKRLITVLNDGQFHSGNTLAQNFSISRHAIWKHISSLIDDGVVIITDKQKGYRLAQPIILLEEDSIRSALDHTALSAIHQMIVLAHVGSTNDYLKNLPLTPLNMFDICLSEQQTLGRGREPGRTWHSPFAKNIYLSLTWNIAQDSSIFAGFSLVIGLAIHYALTKLGITEDLTIKWPNDIYWRGQKLAGILLELHAQAHGFTRLILGVGVNANMEEEQPEISQPWTSIAKILGQPIDRNLLAAKLITSIIQYTQDFTQKGFTNFLPHWERVDYLRDQTISIKNQQHLISGKCKGIDEKGFLLLQTADGIIHRCSSGEASVVKAS